MRADVSNDYDDSTVRPSTWWNEIGKTASPKPYEPSAWAYVEVEEVVEDPDPPSEEEEVDPPWWNSYLEPKPYETSSWTFLTEEVEEEVEEEEEPSWWETIGGEGPKPYLWRSWTFTESQFTFQEFLFLSPSAFTDFDETYFDRTSLGLILDSGYVGQRGLTELYESGIFEGDQRGIMTTQILSKIMVYDSKASSPAVPKSVLPDLQDCPPGVLLGTLSYETEDNVITITDWEHYNWMDDTPVLKAVETLLAKLPASIIEVKVKDDPAPFWTSLGFKPDFKGDPFIHLRTA